MDNDSSIGNIKTEHTYTEIVIMLKKSQIHQICSLNTAINR